VRPPEAVSDLLPARRSDLLPAPSLLLPTAYRRPPTAYCLLPTAYCRLPTAYCLLPTAYCLLPIAYCLLPTRQNLIPPLPEAGRLTDMDPLAEDQVRPERLGDVAEECVADEPEVRVFALEAVAVPLPDVHLDLLFRDGDLIGEGTQGVKIAPFGVGWKGAIAFDEPADAADQAPEEGPPVEPMDALSLAFEVSGRLERDDRLAGRRRPFRDDPAPVELGNGR
jgi:hypothetical protein